jgi:ferredoxin
MADNITSYSDQELLDRWNSERDMNIHEVLFSEIQRRKLYPSVATNAWEHDAGVYPDTEDPQFIEKLMQKQEFAENFQESLLEQQRKKVKPCDSHEEFELTPVQRFVSRFMSPQSPYTSALLFHGVGVGKTCAAITTAEEYLRVYPRQPVFIVAPRNIQPGFRRTIFDDESIKFGVDGLPNESNGCTGNTYLKRTNTEYEKDQKIIQRRVNQSVKSRYIILGYVQFQRYIQSILDQVPKGLTGERKMQEETKMLRKEFSGRLVIIDEAHNLRDTPGEADTDNLDAPGGDAEVSEAKAGKRLTPALLQVVQAAEGMKLMLLTGTPMYNSYKEIIFLLKLLLLNDKKAPISEHHIFDRRGLFVQEDKENNITGGEEKLGAAAGAYVSFMRGENPLSFPVRLDPSGVPVLTTWPTHSPQGEEIFPVEEGKEESESQKRQKRILKKLPFVPVEASGAELKILRGIADTIVETSGLGIQSIDEMVQSGNWLFPDMEGGERIRDAGFDAVFEEVKEGTTSQFTSRIGAEWLAAERISTASPKAALFLNRIPNARGPIFIYSRFIKSGALTIALALEANGYTPWNGKPFLTNGIVGPGRQCALCRARERVHSGKAHTFVPAKYILLTGQANYSPNNAAAIKAARGEKNKDGREIKVIVGSQVASEGIDLRFIREIYVFDSWFHLNKMEQVLGRGIRTCSHSMLPEEQQNCTIHLLVNYYGDVETGDLYMYRMAMIKALQIGRVTRVLKRYALDCNLNHSAILIKDLDPIDKLEDSQGEPRTRVSINDTSYTSICDWTECPYTCAKPIDMKGIKIDMSSYDEYSMQWRSAQIKQIIRRIFEQEQQPMIQIDSLIESLRAADIPELAVRLVLSEIVGQKSFRLKVGAQEGYITYRNNFYLFQPIMLTDLRVPMAFRVADVIVRKDEYLPEKIVYVKPAAPPTEEGTAEPIAQPSSQFKGYWDAITKWAASIRDGSSVLDIPIDVVNTLNDRYKVEDELKRQYNILTIFSWMFENISNTAYPEDARTLYKKLLGDILTEMVWDESLQANEQSELLRGERTPELIAVSEEQIIKKGETEAFLYVSPTTGGIEYECADGTKCSTAVVRILERDLPPVQANRQTTGEIYGFVIPKTKDARLVFKTNDRPVDPGKKPEKGGECEIVSAMSGHKNMLRKIRDMMRNLGYPPFLLTDEVIDEKDTRLKESKKPANNTVISKLKFDSRKFQNTVKACALKNIILRLLDKLEKIKGRKRYFYRPISTIKSGHRLN